MNKFLNEKNLDILMVKKSTSIEANIIQEMVEVEMVWVAIMEELGKFLN